MGKNSEAVDPSIPTNWMIADGNETAGKEIKFASLTPKFDETNHRVYYDLLTRAIGSKDVRNVALTGAYGTGKSSVLAKLGQDLGEDMISISLSTIAPPQRDESLAEENTDERVQANVIQKEIVKQLLYRLPAHKTPKSRFRRTSAPQTKRDWMISSLVGVLFLVVGLGLGFIQPLVESLVSEPWWRRILAYVVLAGGLVFITWLIRRLIAGGTSMSASVGAGLTSVTLSSTSNTYFDEYLDEIVYFFQASRTKVVVIEDIDRFEDIRVFDALRALNVLLNSSSVLDRIVFVYAIRDSIFEKIEGVKHSSEKDATSQAVEVAARAKFFDVIVPVVPFVNADNARDLMSNAMSSEKYSIDQSLIRIAARHVADMRLIHNIRNEFEIYRNRLCLAPAPVYGISDDLVFAMVLFKNAHMADFEKIRHKDSRLDHLYNAWRNLVRSNLRVEANRVAELRAKIEVNDSADARARLWGQRLTEYFETLRASLQTNGNPTTLSFVGEIHESMLQQRATWQSIASGKTLQLQARARSGHTLNFAFSAAQISALLGATIDESEWDGLERSDIEAQISKCEANIQFLRHHTWAELCLRHEFVLEDTETPMTFDQLVHQELGSPLTEELVRRGFITSHFALYTSTYYGTHLGPEALEYVRRCIEPGDPDILFKLDAESIKQLLIEQGAEKDDSAEIFNDASMRNVSIVDYLLEKRPEAAIKIAKGLTAWGAQEVDFVANYCSRGREVEQFLAAMVPWWPVALQYAAGEAPLPSEKRIEVVDAILDSLPRSEGYIVDDKVRDLLETHYGALESVTSPKSPEQAATVIGVFVECKAIIRDVSSLNVIAREQVVDQRIYSVTKGNLLGLVQGGSIALDVLLKEDVRVYQHAIEHLGEYLRTLSDFSDGTHSIEDPQLFSEIVNKAGENGNPENMDQLVSLSSGSCRVELLTEVPQSAWPVIIAEDRTSASFTNIHSYLAEYTQLDETLAAFLIRSIPIEWDVDNTSLEERRTVALAILNAGEVIPDADVRVTLAMQFEPGHLRAESITPDAGEFVGRLIAGGLIADDAETFTSDLILDWETREAAIVNSVKFKSFVSPETLPASHIPQLLRSNAITMEIKETVVNDLAGYLARATKQEAECIAVALNSGGWRIRESRIRELIARNISARQIIELIVREQGMQIDQLRELLRQMGDPYKRLADTGRRPVFLPDDELHLKMLKRLEGVTVSTYKVAGSQLRVNLFHNER